MTEDQIKALVEQANQTKLVEQYQNIIGACEELECGLRNPNLRNIVFERGTNFLKLYVDAKEKEWPELCGKYKSLYQKLTDVIKAQLAERAKLPWYKRIFS